MSVVTSGWDVDDGDGDGDVEDEDESSGQEEEEKSDDDEANTSHPSHKSLLDDGDSGPFCPQPSADAPTASSTADGPVHPHDTEQQPPPQPTQGSGVNADQPHDGEGTSAAKTEIAPWSLSSSSKFSLASLAGVLGWVWPFSKTKQSQAEANVGAEGDKCDDHNGKGSVEPESPPPWNKEDSAKPSGVETTLKSSSPSVSPSPPPVRKREPKLVFNKSKSSSSEESPPFEVKPASLTPVVSVPVISHKKSSSSGEQTPVIHADTENERPNIPKLTVDTSRHKTIKLSTDKPPITTISTTPSALTAPTSSPLVKGKKPKVTEPTAASSSTKKTTLDHVDLVLNVWKSSALLNPSLVSLIEAVQEANISCAEDVVDACLSKASSVISKMHRRGLLTLEDIAVIALYTYDLGSSTLIEGNSYRVLNKALLEPTMENLTKVIHLLVLLLIALRKLPAVPTPEVYRGITKKLTLGKLYSPGKKVTWHTLSSTSTDHDMARRFATGNCGQTGTIFLVKGALWGYNLAPYSMVPQEKEILLEPESQFTVTKTENSSPIVIEMEMLRCKLLLQEAAPPAYSDDNPIEFLSDSAGNSGKSLPTSANTGEGPPPTIPQSSAEDSETTIPTRAVFPQDTDNSANTDNNSDCTVSTRVVFQDTTDSSAVTNTDGDTHHTVELPQPFNVS